MFTMSRFWEKFFYILSFLFQGSAYLSAYTYGVMHRFHHAYADTEKDPHSPKYDHNIWKMMWRTKVVYSDLFYGRTKVEEKWTKNVPAWHSFDKFANAWVCRIGWMVFYTWFYIEFATAWWMYLLLPIHFLMGPVHGAIINWFAHKIGKQRYKVNDTSTNLYPVDLLMLGEGYHNNHHRWPQSANFGKVWYEFDPIYPLILLFNGVGIIKLKKESR